MIACNFFLSLVLKPVRFNVVTFPYTLILKNVNGWFRLRKDSIVPSIPSQSFSCQKIKQNYFVSHSPLSLSLEKQRENWIAIERGRKKMGYFEACNFIEKRPTIIFGVLTCNLIGLKCKLKKEKETCFCFVF